MFWMGYLARARLYAKEIPIVVYINRQLTPSTKLEHQVSISRMEVERAEFR